MYIEIPRESIIIKINDFSEKLLDIKIKIQNNFVYTSHVKDVYKTYKSIKVKNYRYHLKYHLSFKNQLINLSKGIYVFMANIIRSIKLTGGMLK